MNENDTFFDLLDDFDNDQAASLVSVLKKVDPTTLTDDERKVVSDLLGAYND